MARLRKEHLYKSYYPETCLYVSITHYYFSQTTYSTFYVMVSFLNKHLEFQDKVVNINKFLVNVTTWQYDKAQFDNGSKGANVRLQPKRRGKSSRY